MASSLRRPDLGRVGTQWVGGDTNYVSTNYTHNAKLPFLLTLAPPRNDPEKVQKHREHTEWGKILREKRGPLPGRGGVGAEVKIWSYI